MDRNAIATIAKGLAPLVREVVVPLEERIAAFETLPPELAEQVARAVRMLHESPAIEPRSEPPRAPPKVTRIERDADGNFVPVYDETQP